MRQARAFFYVAAGVFLLMASYHFGAGSAKAQTPGYGVAAFISFPVGSNVAACITDNGDVYTTANSSLNGAWVWQSNVFTSTPVQTESWGAVKARYRQVRP